MAELARAEIDIYLKRVFEFLLINCYFCVASKKQCLLQWFPVLSCFLQIITNEEAERRGHVYDCQGSTYLFDLDYVEDVYTVDAAHQGNISHFVNHSVSVIKEDNITVFV